MALADVNSIMQALAARHQRVYQQQQLQLQQQTAQSENDARAAEIQQRKDELSERSRQFDITSKAAQAMHKLSMLEEERKLTENPDAVRQMPGDTLVDPGKPDANGNVFETHSLPGVDDNITIPSHATAIKMLGEQKAAEDAPGHANRMAELQQSGETQEELATINSDREQKRLDEQLKAENARSAAENATRIQAAKISAGEDGSEADLISNYGQRAVNGDLTAEQLHNANIPKGTKTAINNYAVANSGTLISQKQQDLASNYSQAVDVFKNIDAYNDLRKNSNWLQFNTPGSQTYQQRKAIEGMIDSKLPSITKNFSQLNRLNVPEMNGVAQGVMPGSSVFSSNPQTNEMKRNGFLEDLTHEFDSQTANLPAPQRALLKARTGLTQIPYLQGGKPAVVQNVQAPGASAQQPAPGQQLQDPAGVR